MGLTLTLKQEQKLSPQLIQAIEILQLDALELKEYIDKAVLENPVLEITENEPEESQPECAQKLMWLASDDRQNIRYYREDADTFDIAAPESDVSLYDHLMSQLDPASMTAELQQAASCVAMELDDNGYLDSPEEYLAARCGQTIETIRQAEDIIRALKPAGVGARSLSQCLALQLERQGIDGLALQLAKDHLEDIAHEHYNHIAKVTGADRTQIQRACTVIRALDPRPGLPFCSPEHESYIVPDLIVTDDGEELFLRSCSDSFPTLQIGSYYAQLYKDTNEAEVREYLEKKLQQARWMIQAIEQRESTLLKCAGIITQRQRDFFFNGPAHLKPLLQIELADEIGVHESTISRAIRGKYLQCRHGTFPLSYFFSRALPSSGADRSGESIKHLIKGIIDGEDKKHPLSDQKICDMLCKQGIDIARRTVAKYREKQMIPSAPGRRIL